MGTLTLLAYAKMDGYNNRKAFMTAVGGGATMLGVDLVLHSIWRDEDIESIDFSTSKDAAGYMKMLISPLLNAVVGNYVYDKTVRDNYGNDVNTWTNSKGMLVFGGNEIVA